MDNKLDMDDPSIFIDIKLRTYIIVARRVRIAILETPGWADTKRMEKSYAWEHLLKYVRIARRAKGSTGQVLLQLLEMRLDNILFRLGMAPTIPGARQLVNHGHIRVNDHMVDIPSYPCKPQDVITIRDQQRLRAIIKKNIDLFQRDKLPNHLTFHSLQYKGFINQIIDSKWINLKINELLVVEYYSRQAWIENEMKERGGLVAGHLEIMFFSLLFPFPEGDIL